MSFHASGPFGAYLRGTINEYAEHHKEVSDPPSVCESCKLYDPTYFGTTLKTRCALHELKKESDKKLTVSMAVEASIDTSLIHKKCPKGYFRLSSKER